jgi:aminoglycoside phosphotransferase (APT) family kinase protein
VTAGNETADETGPETGIDTGNESGSEQRRQNLARWAASCIGVNAVELREFLGGAGNVGYEVIDPGAPGAGPVAFLRTKMAVEETSQQGTTLAREGEILRVAAALGFPVADVLGISTEPDALLMSYVDGDARPDADEIERVAPQYLGLVAAVHTSDATRFPVEQHATMRAAILADMGRWKADAVATGVMDEPIVALATRVLQERMPAGEGPPALVHGDVGAGNFLARDGQVTAMLDWELAHLGDPMEDMAWLWMRGAHTSFGDPKRRFAEYEAASGRAIDDDRLAWHVAYVMWKSISALHGRLRSVVPGELAMVQLVVALTYDALLGAQLVRVLGGSLRLLEQTPQPAPSVTANLAEELLHVTDLETDRRVVLEYLRDAAALADWERRELERECTELLEIKADDLVDHIRSCPSDALLAAATVVARAADRAAAASPKSIRRIERAQRIGLGS